MPSEAYIAKKGDSSTDYRLLLISWSKFKGRGGKPGEEYWVLGDQFLQNYYSIYDFKNNKVGLVESVNS